MATSNVKLYLIDYRKLKKDSGETDPSDFIVERVVGSVEWECPQGLSEKDVRYIINNRSNVNVHIRAPKKVEAFET